MPPHFFPTEATLDEVLFVLGEPISEEEVWAILYNGSVALIKYFAKQTQAHQIHYLLPAINPDTLLLGIDGTVNFLTKKPENAPEPRPVPLLNFDDRHYVSPEALANDITTCKQPKYTKTAIEKMFIYSLGMCMVTSLRHRTVLPLEDQISVELQACLSIMAEESMITRISAESLKKVSLKHIDANRAALCVKNLSKEILGCVERRKEQKKAELILPNPRRSLRHNQPKNHPLHSTHNHITAVNPAQLKLPIPDNPKKKKKKGATEHSRRSYENLLLPVSPSKPSPLPPKSVSADLSSVVSKDESSAEGTKYLSPKHIEHIRPLSSLSMSKTNDSVDMSRALHSSTPSEPLSAHNNNTHKLTMEFDGNMTTTVVIAERDSTLDVTDQTVDAPSMEYLPILRNNPKGEHRSRVIPDTNEDVMVIEEEKILEVSGLHISEESPVPHKPPAYMAPPHPPVLYPDTGHETTATTTTLSTVARIEGETSSSPSPPLSPRSALPASPLISPPSSVPSPLVTSPGQLSPARHLSISVTAISVPDSSIATPISPTSLNMSTVPAVTELSRISSVDDVARREEDESMTSIDFSTQPERSLSPASAAATMSPPLPIPRRVRSPTPSPDQGDMSTSVDVPIEKDHSHLHSFFSPSPMPDDEEEEEGEEEDKVEEEVVKEVQGGNAEANICNDAVATKNERHCSGSNSSSKSINDRSDNKLTKPIAKNNKMSSSFMLPSSPAPSSGKGSVRSIPRRHSASSYRSTHQNTSLNSSLSQMSLQQGAYSLEQGVNMELMDYPLRFKSAGAFSLCGGGAESIHSIPGTPSREGYRKEVEVPQAGPEFVRIPSDPTTGFVDITPTRLGPLPKKNRLVSVILLNGQEVQTQVHVSSKGKELFEQIAVHIGLKESLYFGFALLEDGEHMFIDLDEKLVKYAPLGWKDEGSKKKKGEYVLHFKVKFFLEFPTAIKHKLTSHFCYLHLRKSILTGYTYTTDDSLLLRLGGYALQAEYGDFLHEFAGCEYFRLEHYLPPYILSRVSHSDLYCNLSGLHQTLLGRTTEEAEMGFLAEVTNVEEYGVLFHKVSRSKDDPTDTVLLGISINGIIIKEHKRNQRKLVHQQGWDSIKKFDFDKKQFKLKSKCAEDAKMIFYTNNYRKSKYLVKMCQSFHRFQIFNQPNSKQSIKIKDQYQTLQSNHSADPLQNNMMYSTLKGSDIADVSFKSADLKTSNEIKFVEQQEKEEFSERSVDVVSSVREPSMYEEKPESTAPSDKHGGDSGDSEGKIHRSATCDKNLNTLASADDAMAFDNAMASPSPPPPPETKTPVTTPPPQVAREEKNSPRSIYSDDASACYTDSEFSNFRNEYLQQRPPCVDVVDDGLSGGSGGGGGPVQPYSLHLNNSLHDSSNCTSSSLSRANSEQYYANGGAAAGGAGGLMKRFGGMENLDGISPGGSFRSSVRSDGNQSVVIYASGSDHFEEVSRTLKSAQPEDDRGSCDHNPCVPKNSDLVRSSQDTSEPSASANATYELSSSLKANSEPLPSLNEVSELKGTSVELEKPSQSQQVIDVVLEKKNGSFGFSIMGGGEAGNGVYIKSLLPNGAASCNGVLQEGDRLLLVDGVAFDCITHDKAVETLKQVRSCTTFRISRQNPQHIPLAGQDKLRHDQKLRERLQFTPAKDQQLKKHEQKQIQQDLYDREKQVQQLQIQQQQPQEHVQGTVIQCAEQLPQKPTWQQHKEKVHPEKGQQKQNTIQEQLQPQLQQQGQQPNLQTQLKPEPRGTPPRPLQLQQQPRQDQLPGVTHFFEVAVEKEEGGIGLCLAGGTGADPVFKGQIMIRKIFPGKPADRCGEFKIGDVLIAINDQLTEGMTHHDALTTIRSSTGQVSFVARRPQPNEIPSQLFLPTTDRINLSPRDIMRDILNTRTNT